MEIMDTSIISTELQSSERILWAGKSNPNKIFGQGDLLMIPFGIFYLAFALFWIKGASSGSGFFWLFGIPIFCIGIYIFIGRYFVKLRNKKYTYYAITNTRVMEIKTYPNGNKKSVNACEIGNVPKETVNYDKNGIGTIIFGNYVLNNGLKSTRINIPTEVADTGVVIFLDIDDCHTVYNTYQNAKLQLQNEKI